MLQTQLQSPSVTALHGSKSWADVRETHIGVVFLLGDLAYKMKKPVDLGFLDFTTLESRKQVCRKEVTLNRRLAPDVYLGVADVTGPDGRVSEYLVKMRRMPDDRRLSTLVSQGTPMAEVIYDLAKMFAEFHDGADRGTEIAEQGSREAILSRWRASFDQVRPFHGSVLDPDVATEIEQLAEEFLAGRKELFDRRIAAGRVVDGHGDLIADDIFCLEDGPRVLDCLEFDDRLRWLDGLDDVAFLAMDLERLGSPELGTALLDRYATLAGDPAPLALRHHYIAYRAFVRVKVACLRHAQGDEDSALLARKYADIALKHLRLGAVRLIMVGGLPASGKSTLAAAIGEKIGATVLRSDRIRKELAGIAPEHSAAAGYEQGLYDPVHTERTYAEMNRRAERLLGLGESAVLDASWNAAERHLTAAGVGARTQSRVIPLRCWAPEATTIERLASRTDSVSDATAAVARRMAASTSSWPDAHTVLTAGTKQDSLTQALAYLS